MISHSDLYHYTQVLVWSIYGCTLWNFLEFQKLATPPLRSEVECYDLLDYVC